MILPLWKWSGGVRPPSVVPCGRAYMPAVTSAAVGVDASLTADRVLEQDGIGPVLDHDLPEVGVRELWG